MIQKELFRTSVLIKVQGMLALLEVDPSAGGPGKCPICKGTAFREAPHGWIECDNDCDFSLLKSHIDQIDNQWSK